MSSFFAAALIGISLIIGSSYIFYRWELKAALIFIPLILFSVMYGDHNKNIPAMLVPFIIGGLCGYTFKTGRSLKFFILSSSLSLAVVFAGNFYYQKIYGNINYLEDSKALMIKLIDSYKLPPHKKKQIIEDFDKMAIIASDLIPFSSFIYSLLLSSMGYLIAKLFYLRIPGFTNIKGIESFRLNDYTIFLLIAGWLLFILSDADRNYIIYYAGINIALITSILYFLQAMGVIKHFLLKKNLPSILLPLSLFIVLIIGLEAAIFVSILLTGLGTLDLWADFRKIGST